MRKSVIIILLLLGINTINAEEISNQEVVDFANAYLTTYKSYVDFEISGENKDFKNEKGHYVFFLYKQYPFHVRTQVLEDSVGYEFIPSNDYSIEISRERNITDFKWAWIAIEELARNESIFLIGKTLKEEDGLGIRIRNSMVQNKEGARVFAQVRVVPNSWFGDPNGLAVKDFNSDKHQVEIIKISEIWSPFIRKNEVVIESNPNLFSAGGIIQRKIEYDLNYTFEMFLSDFDHYNRSVEHYKDLPIIFGKWNEFVNSNEDLKYIDPEKFPDIHSQKTIDIYSKAINIRETIASNETYLLADFEADLQELNDLIKGKSTEYPQGQLNRDWNWFWNSKIRRIAVYLIGIIGAIVTIYKFTR